MRGQDTSRLKSDKSGVYKVIPFLADLPQGFNLQIRQVLLDQSLANELRKILQHF